MRSSFLCLMFVLSFFTLTTASLHAQNASISGQVIDPSGALVKNVQITLTNDLTNTVLKARTNGVGIYSLPFVAPGKYILHAEVIGFSPYTQTGITVTTAQNLELDFRIKVGSESQSVMVDGSGAKINTADASVSTVIDRQFVENIPLNGRSFQSLMTAIPGVSSVPSTGVGYGGELTVNGQRTEANYFTVDGVSANTGVSAIITGAGGGAGFSGSTPSETVLGTTQSLISIDALQEFRASTSTYSAEYGRTPGGQFSFESRAGTNQWHGSAFDYLRNSALDANNWFNGYMNNPPIAKAAERQNDFGGTLSGPIHIPFLYNGTNRSFFFFSYEGLRLTQPQAATTYDVPTLALRQQAPAVLQPFLNAFPVSSSADEGNGLAPFVTGFSIPTTSDAVSVRIDHNFNDRFNIFGRYSYTPSDSGNHYTYNPAILTPLHGKVEGVTLGATSIFSSRFSNVLRFNFTSNDQGESYTLTDLGGATPFAINSVPEMTSDDWLYFVIFFGLRPKVVSAPLSSHQQQINLTDATNAVIGRHNFRWGVDYRRLSTSQQLPSVYEFADVTDESQLINNQFDEIDLTRFTLPVKPVYTNFSAYAQDEWKVSQRLNLSLGLRWDLNPAPGDSEGNVPYTITTIDLASASLAGKSSPLWKTTYGNFAPRVGLAYQVHQNPGHETVLRAGIGMFYDTGNTQASQGYNAVGFSSITSLYGAAFPATQTQIDEIPPTSTSSPYNNSVFAYDPHLKLPCTLQWNVAVEQGLGDKQTLLLNYVASAGRRLLSQKEYFPSLFGNSNFASGGALYITSNAASSDFNSLQVQLNRRLSRGLQVLSSYTWSHAIDNASSNFQIYELERAASDYDIRSNFQLSLTYETPRIQSARTISVLLNNWNVEGRVSARSSLPIDLIGSTTIDEASGSEVYFHPNSVAGQPVYQHVSGVPGGRVINYQAFIQAPADTEGNVGRNSVRGFEAAQADVAIHRDFSVFDNLRLQCRIEAFNVLNHPVFGAVYSQLSYGSGRFGYAYNTQNSQLGGLSPIYQAGGPRSLQVALRLHF